MRVDLYTKVALTVIALLLAVLVLRPVVSPAPVQAQSEAPSLYIEPGITNIRNPNGPSDIPGKMVVDLRTGDVWGFPTILTTSSRPPTSQPTYLGKFDFSAMQRTP